MKKLSSVMAILSLTLFVSCSGGGSPESVVEKFLGHVYKGEVEEAKKYSDENTASNLSEMAGRITPEKKEELKKMDTKIEVISSDIQDETAVVKYKTTSKGETSREQTIILIKVDGDWKVSKERRYN
jgi:Domain of unknown function (DUF4878)